MSYVNFLQTNLNSVVHGDCVEIMQRMEPASIDFIVTDPPSLRGIVRVTAAP